VPRGVSLRARQFIVELNKGDVSTDRLTKAQAAGAEGLFAAAMAAFLRWAASRLDTLRVDLKSEVARYRSMPSPWSHRRTLDTVAHLGFGFRTLVTFAVEVEAISEAEADELVAASRDALMEQAGEQAEHIRDADPNGLGEIADSLGRRQAARRTGTSAAGQNGANDAT